jgi:hypothetical protein
MIFSCVGYEDLGPSKVVLDDGRLSGSVMKDGKFVMSVGECLDCHYGNFLTCMQYPDPMYDLGHISSQSSLTITHLTP